MDLSILKNVWTLHIFWIYEAHRPLWSHVLLLIFFLVYFYNLCSTSDIFSNNCKPIICTSCYITLMVWVKLCELNCRSPDTWQANSVTCSAGCTTVTLLLQIHYFSFSLHFFWQNILIVKSNLFIRTILLFMYRKKNSSVLPLSIVWKC